MSLALLERALVQAEGLVAGIRPDQWNLPTPCASWDVRQLVEHLVDEINRFAIVTGGRPGRDGTFRGAAAALLRAWAQPGADERSHQLPFGERPASWAIEQQITELTVHAWDLAKATGRSTDLDPELGAIALRWGSANLLDEFRGAESDGAQIGPKVDIAADAPLYDRIAALGGRDPA